MHSWFKRNTCSKFHIIERAFNVDTPMLGQLHQGVHEQGENEEGSWPKVRQELGGQLRTVRVNLLLIRVIRVLGF